MARGLDARRGRQLPTCIIPWLSTQGGPTRYLCVCAQGISDSSSTHKALLGVRVMTNHCYKSGHHTIRYSALIY